MNHPPLPVHPPKNCLGIKCCYATGCRGYDGTIKNRELNTVCDTVLASINQKLDALAVSNSCKNYLHKDKRKSECYDDVRYGEVFGAKFITFSTQAAVNLPFSGFSFCRSTTFNIAAVLNDCVDVAGFSLSGPNGYSRGSFENNYPYSVFGDDTDTGKFYGGSLPHLGLYTLIIKPDNYVEKQKTLTFTVNNC